jgi:formamidopyrimidine-DNA glycosylase
MGSMPELPEVETIVRDLRARILGRRIRAVWTSGKPLRLARPIDVEGLRRVVLGQQVEAVRRIGKYVLIDVARGTVGAKAGAKTGAKSGAQARVGAERALPGVLVHLGMSGRLVLEPGDAPRGAHTHLVLALDDAQELRFRDPRRFGWIAAGDPVDGCTELEAMGPDPLGALTAAALGEALAGVRAPIKAFLLDQRRIAGIGNIYACEALFRAGLHPAVPAGRTVRSSSKLLVAIREALELGIQNRGTTLRDYVDALGDGGRNAGSLLVYGRAGQPCRVCGTPIRRRVDAGRSSYLCPRCQPAPRRAPLAAARSRRLSPGGAGARRRP